MATARLASARPLTTINDIADWVNEYRAQGMDQVTAYATVWQTIEQDGREAEVCAAIGGTVLVAYAWSNSARKFKQRVLNDSPDEATEATMLPLAAIVDSDAPRDPEPPTAVALMGRRHDVSLLQTTDGAPAVFGVEYLVNGLHLPLGEMTAEQALSAAVHKAKLMETYGWDARFLTALAAGLPSGKRMREHYTAAEVLAIRMRTRLAA